MSISITQLILIILFSAFMVFFAAELGDTGKKIWKKQWVQIFIPLIGASILVISYESALYQIVTSLDKLMYNSVSQFLLDKNPSYLLEVIVNTLVIIVYTIIPYGTVQLGYRLYYRKSFNYGWELMLFSWVAVSCIVLIGLSNL